MAQEITIVTNRLFLKTKGVISVGLSDQITYNDNNKVVESVYWRIDIYYLYDTGSNNNSGGIDSRHTNLEIKKSKDAHAEFLDIVKQIRDQNPDDNMISSLFEKALAANEAAKQEEKEDKKSKKAKKGKQ